MTQAIRNAEWFTWYPENYRWSFNMMLAVGAARTGGGDMGEIDRVARRMAGNIGDDGTWFAEWEKMAAHTRGLAEEAEAAGKLRSAASHWRRTAMYHFTSEHFRFPKDELAMESYRNQVHAFHKIAECSPHLGIEFVDIAFDNREPLPGFFVPAQNTSNPTPPCVIFFNGFDGNKEFNFFLGIEEIVARGVSVLSVDCPGTGESVRFRDNYLRYDYEVAAGACIDYLETRDDVDADRVGIMALSLGGYYATRSASLEKRLKACVAWGAIWDYHAIWKRRIEAAFNLALPVPGAHLQWSTNTTDSEGALKAIEGFKLDGVVQQMECPYLLVHGEDDQQVPLEDARKLFEACGSSDKTFRIFSSEEGGAQHCHVDNLSIATPVIFDWLADRLGASA